jgi:hypothetical protein
MSVAIQTPGGGSSVSQASQSAIEAETNEDTYIPPDKIRFSPGVAKFWVRYDQIGTLAVEASYNVTSVADDGTGDSTVTIADDFSDAEICTLGMSVNSGGTATFGTYTVCDAFAAGSVNVFTRLIGGGAATDMDPVMIAGFGDQ